MRLDFDHASSSAVRLSIAAAMVIAKPVYGKLFIFFGDCDLCKERSTKSNDRAVEAGGEISAWRGRDGGIWEPFSGTRGAGTRLSQRLLTADAAAHRRRRCHFAVRTRAPAAHRALSTAPIMRNHGQIS